MFPFSSVILHINDNFLKNYYKRIILTLECQNTALFKQLEQSSDKKDAENVGETAKLDESFATLYDLDLPHGGRCSINQIQTARLVDIDGSQLEASTQTEHVDQKYDSGDDDDDLQSRLNRRRSWMISSEERKINATVENLSKEIKKLKDFVKLKDASILLMKLVRFISILFLALNNYC